MQMFLPMLSCFQRPGQAKILMGDENMLPNACSFSGGWFEKSAENGKQGFRCNFVPVIVSTAIDDPAQSGDPFIEFYLIIEGKRKPMLYHYRLSDIQKINFENLDISCEIEGDSVEVGRTMQKFLRRQVRESKSISTSLQKTGWTSLDNGPVYVSGNRVIGPDGWISANKYILPQGLEDLSLEVDNNISEFAAAGYVQKLCTLYPGVSDMLVSAAVVAHLFSLFETAGVRPRLTMYIVGPPTIGKTTLARLIGQTYNRSAPDDPHLVNLISTTAAVHSRVAALSDCVCIVDDLYPSNSLAETRRREERLGEIIRTTGNGTAKEKMDGKQAVSQVPRGVVFTTAEYSLTTLSTVARVVTLPMKAPINAHKLSLLQAEPKMLSIFWFYFLQWACCHHDDLIDRIRSQFAKLRQQESLGLNIDRVLDSHRVLAIGMEILAEYMAAVAPEKIKVIQKLQRTFAESSAQVYRRQKRELEQLRSRSEQNRFSKFLAGLCFSGQIEEGKKKKLGKEYPAVISHGLLYIRLEDLTRRIRRHFGDSTVTPRAISAELRRNGLLQMDKSGRSSKKVNKVRYLQVPVDRLEEFTSAESSVSSVGLELPTNGTVNPVDCILSSGRCAK